MITKPIVKPTKERLYLEHADYYGIETIARHINRYKWAMSKLRSSDTVLDAGCGSGYGDAILLEACASLVGVDRSKEAIDYARWKAEKLKLHRATYYCQSLEALDFVATFTACVCIEVIEHLNIENQNRFLKNLGSFLVPDGRLYITTPVKGTNPVTEFHEHEHSLESFQKMLEYYFESVTFDKPSDFKIDDRFILACCKGVRS